MSAPIPRTFLSSESRFCRSCDRQVTSKPRLRFAPLAIVMVTALVLVMVGFSALIGPFIMFTVPLIMIAGFAIGPLVAIANEPPTCPHCERELVYASRNEVMRKIERTRPRQAPVGDMKAA